MVHGLTDLKHANAVAWPGCGRMLACGDVSQKGSLTWKVHMIRRSHLICFPRWPVANGMPCSKGGGWACIDLHRQLVAHSQSHCTKSFVDLIPISRWHVSLSKCVLNNAWQRHLFPYQQQLQMLAAEKKYRWCLHDPRRCHDAYLVVWSKNSRCRIWVRVGHHQMRVPGQVHTEV